jgi:hypothetical protein
MQREAGQEPVLRGAAAAAHTPLQPALDWLDDPPDMGAKRAPTSTPWTMRGCLVIRCALLGTAAVPHASPPAVTRWNIWCPVHCGGDGLSGRGRRISRLDHPFDHPDDPTGPYSIRLDRRGTQREQARSDWSRPDRRRAPGYGSGGCGLTYCPLVGSSRWCYDAVVGMRLGRGAEGEASDSTRALGQQQEVGT